MVATTGVRFLESISANPATPVDAFVRWRAVRLSGDLRIDPVTAADQDPIGILEIPPYGQGGAAAVCILGRTKAEAGAPVAAGAWLGVDAQGRVVPATEATANTTTGAISGTRAFAIALESAAAAGAVIEILVVRAGLV